MAEEIIYADLNVLEDSSPTSQPSLLKRQDLQGSLRWHRLVLWIALAGNVILATMVIVLGILDSSSCRLCPMDWLSHRGKCYWFSKENTFWNKSHDDCLARRSQMLVIQDLEEMEFISNFTQDKYRAWLGLRVIFPAKNWTWVDSSVLNQTLFTVSGSTDGNSCGVIKSNQIHSEICSAVFKWICQKEAVVL